jgi:hypothetical protein
MKGAVKSVSLQKLAPSMALNINACSYAKKIQPCHGGSDRRGRQFASLVNLRVSAPFSSLFGGSQASWACPRHVLWYTFWTHFWIQWVGRLQAWHEVHFKLARSSFNSCRRGSSVFATEAWFNWYTHRKNHATSTAVISAAIAAGLLKCR